MKEYVAKEFSQLEMETINSVAKKYGRTGAEVLYRFAYQEGIVILPKSIRGKRREQNKNVENWKLAAEDMRLLRKLDRNNYTYSDEIYNHQHWAADSLKKNGLFIKHRNK